MSTPEPRPRGFQTLSAQRRIEIASQGGKAAHREGRAHQFTSEEARAAALKSVAARAAKKKAR